MCPEPAAPPLLLHPAKEKETKHIRISLRKVTAMKGPAGTGQGAGGTPGENGQGPAVSPAVSQAVFPSKGRGETVALPKA